jgi:hypothetical protein
MLEVNTLKKTPVPNPIDVSNSTMNKIINLVNDRLNLTGYEAVKLEREIDNLVADLYLLSEKEKEVLGLIY